MAGLRPARSNQAPNGADPTNSIKAAAPVTRDKTVVVLAAPQTRVNAGAGVSDVRAEEKTNKNVMVFKRRVGVVVE